MQNLIKFIFVFIISTQLVACGKKNENYYWHHPESLQKALNLCPGTQPKEISCEDLQRIARKLNDYSYELRKNPQEFGGEILKLQQKIGKKSKLNENTASLKNELQERLAVVKWLESPR